MEDAETIDILKKMLERYRFDNAEKQALLNAIGILSWSTLMKGYVERKKKSQKRKMEDVDRDETKEMLF